MVDKFRKKLGEAVTSADTYVVGDIAKVGEGLCWPCVNMKWDLGKEAKRGWGWKQAFSKLLFACIRAGTSLLKRKPKRFSW